MNTAKTVEVPLEFLQVLHDYLMDKPMREVEMLVSALRALKPVPAKSE